LKERVTIPKRLNRIKNLQKEFDLGSGATRNITLEEITDEDDCPLKLLLKINGVTTNFENNDHIQCVKGDIEKWNFINPTADVHPFHWHAIAVQCGLTEESINTNILKDTVQIPNSEDDYDVVTTTCYVACTPNDYLLEGSTSSPTDFGFDTSTPYVVHCHMLEHEENAMMTYFYLADSDSTNAE
jgi:FtsP/CotA-like multicopper oxidase with cupredoxin domain